MEKISLDNLLKLDISGKVICFPTDTVYGVGAKVLDLKAIEKIYAMKKRDENKPLAILTATADISLYVDNINFAAKDLMENKWPGPLTLIFKKSNAIDTRITQGSKTVAFRMPNSKIALQILSHFGPMATTSVNIANQPPLNSVTEIEAEFSYYIDYIVTDIETMSKQPSSVIDVTEEKIKVIR